MESMVFGRRRHEAEPDESHVALARARYVLRTVDFQTLSRILDEVLSGMEQDSREEWRIRLAQNEIPLQSLTSTSLIDALENCASDPARQALATSVTHAVAEALNRSLTAAPAFHGFLSSPEAREAGVPDPATPTTRRRRLAEPPYLPGTTAGGRR